MSDTHYAARSVHDLGLAVWFGGSLMGAIGLNGAVAKAKDPTERLKLSHEGWTRFAPVQAAGIAGYLAGASRLTVTDGYRVKNQAGLGSSSITKTVLSGLALGATAWSGALNLALLKHRDEPTKTGTQPSAETPASTAKKMKQLQALQWAIPGLTSGLIISSAIQGEQQRPQVVAKGLVKGLVTR